LLVSVFGEEAPASRRGLGVPNDKKRHMPIPGLVLKSVQLRELH